MQLCVLKVPTCPVSAFANAETAQPPSYVERRSAHEILSDLCPCNLSSRVRRGISIDISRCLHNIALSICPGDKAGNIHEQACSHILLLLKELPAAHALAGDQAIRAWLSNGFDGFIEKWCCPDTIKEFEEGISDAISAHAVFRLQAPHD
jgi:hypothetical protein